VTTAALVAMWVWRDGTLHGESPCGSVPADGRLEWRCPRSRSRSVSLPLIEHPCSSASPLDLDIFTRRGELFDGRPVFCQSHWTTRLWASARICLDDPRVIDQTDANLSTDAYRWLDLTIRHEFHIGQLGGPIGRILDERVSIEPWTLAELDDLDPDGRSTDRLRPRQGLTKREVRLLVLVPTEIPR
jgi:hypothetical protein